MDGGNGEAVPAKDYNDIFDLLLDIEDEDGIDADVTHVNGFIAYGLYKVSKRDWSARIRKKHGRAPTREELDAYRLKWGAPDLRNLKNEAETVLLSYAEQAIEEVRPDILKEAARGSFLKGVAASMVAAFLYTLLLIAFATILSRSGIDLLSIFGNVNAPVSQSAASPATTEQSLVQQQSGAKKSPSSGDKPSGGKEASSLHR